MHNSKHHGQLVCLDFDFFSHIKMLNGYFYKKLKKMGYEYGDGLCAFVKIVVEF